MNRNVIVVIFVVFIVGGIYAFYAYMKQYSPKYSWSEYYNIDNDQPYGLKIFYDLLDEGENEITKIKGSLLENIDTTVTNTNYIAVGDFLFYDSTRVDHLLKYVENGNVVLVVSNSAPLKITKMVVPYTDTIYNYDYYSDSLVSVVFEKSKNENPLSFHYQYLKDTAVYEWGAYSEEYFNDTLVNYGFKPISYLNKKINCYYFNYGKGKVIVHSNPILFTNYNIIQKQGLNHANKVLANLNSGNIYWDNISQNPINSSSENGMSSENPLKFLFSHYTLRWGWYLFLITIVLYLLFRSKREQRIIPILAKNSNSSIEYTKAIGILYFQKGQHKLIANEMHLLFMAELRNKYNISTSIEEPKLIDLVAAKSGLKKEFINDLFKHFRKVRYSPMANSKDLINLHNAVEFYYKNCN